MAEPMPEKEEPETIYRLVKTNRTAPNLNGIPLDHLVYRLQAWKHEEKKKLQKKRKAQRNAKKRTRQSVAR